MYNPISYYSIIFLFLYYVTVKSISWFLWDLWKSKFKQMLSKCKQLLQTNFYLCFYFIWPQVKLRYRSDTHQCDNQFHKRIFIAKYMSYCVNVAWLFHRMQNTRSSKTRKKNCLMILKKAVQCVWYLLVGILTVLIYYFFL